MSSRIDQRTGSRRWIAGVVATLLAFGGVVALPQTASAAGPVVVSGVVASDANGNGVRDTSAQSGRDDRPLVGVPVSLVCVNGGGVLATVATDANGRYEFGDADLSASCVGDVRVRLETSSYANNIYLTEAASADNSFGETGPTTAQTSAFTPSVAAPIERNALLTPVWSIDLALASDPNGFGGNSVYTGTGPFDASDTVAGQDASANNGRVRSGDTVAYNWSLTVSSTQPLGSAAGSAIFEQTLDLVDGAVANFSTIPAVCSGTTPASAIIAYPSGTQIAPMTAPPAGTTSVVLRCNLGAVGEDTSAILLPSTVWVSNESPNGSSYSTTARAYGVDPAGTATIQPSSDVENGPIDITAAPRYDIAKTQIAAISSTQTINGQAVAGYLLDYQVTVATDRKIGTEAFQQPITFTENLWGQHTSAAGSNGPAGSTLSGLNWYLLSCNPMRGGGVNENMVILGRVAGASNPAAAASDSGTCTGSRAAGDTTGAYTMTLSGIDTSGRHYPTQTLGGTSLASGPYYVASYRVQLFVPLTEVDKAQGGASDSVGQLSLFNKLGDFSPVGVSGVSNYGTGFEPGYCDEATPSSSTGTPATGCNPMPDGSRSNNVAGPLTVTLGQAGWGKAVMRNVDAWADTAGLWSTNTIRHGGDTQVQPGSYASVQASISNTSAVALTNVGICDVFDNTTARLSTLDRTVLFQGEGRPSVVGLHAYVLESGTVRATNTADGRAYQQSLQPSLPVQYAHVDLGADTANNGVYDDTTGRYGGSWSTQSGVNCGNPTITWYDSPESVPGGIDAVNAVRVVASPNYVLPSGAGLSLWIPFQQRDTFNGGPNDGELIPSGTVVADFAQVTSDQQWRNWSSGRGYVPQPETGNTDGDRWTVARAYLRLDKRTITVDGVGSGAAAIGNTGTALAGSPVVWEVLASLTADTSTPGPVDDVVITDTLPRYVQYNEACTESITGGTPPDTVTPNANGTTTLTWRLGTVTPNTAIEPRRICTDTDVLTPNRTSLINTASVTAAGVIPTSAATDTHTVILEQTGQVQLQKRVDRAVDLQDDNQAYTLTVKNFSETLQIESPTVIEVLSYNGDGSNTAGVNRTPASSYSGTNTLRAAPTAVDFGGTTPVAGTFYYTTIPSAQIPQNLNQDTNPSIWSTTVTDWSTVTGFKFVAASALTTTSNSDRSGLRISYTVDQDGNNPGDRYANRFTAFSPTLRNGTQYQLLTSNQTNVRILGFSLGDLIWTDEDGDGKFTPGTDTTAPAGVQVQVYRDGDTTPVATATTDAAGRWSVNNLPEGDYYVVIPASQFADGAPLANRMAAPGGVDSNIPDNEQVDHNAIAADGGVRSIGVVTLSATQTATTITGNGPLDDNVADLSVPSGTTDSFTNFTVDLALERVPGYEFTKSADPVSGSSVPVGSTMTYTLTGTNTGATTLDPVVVTDDLSEVLTAATLDPASVTAVVNGVAVDAPTVTGTTLEWTGVLREGEAVTITYSVTVNDDAQGKRLHNIATSTATPPGGPEITPPPRETEHPVPGYEFSKTSDPADGSAVPAGGTITYTLTGTNTGASTLDPVVITDDLSGVLDHADLVSSSVTATIDGATTTAPTIDGTTLGWTGSLDGSETIVITYQVKLHDDAAGSVLTNTATSTATPPDGPDITPPPGTTEHPVPGYAFEKSANPATGTAVAGGDEISYTLTGTNTGATTLTDVTLTDDLSQVLAYADLVGDPVVTVNGEPAATPVTVDGTTLSWLGELPVAAEVVITYTVVVHDDAHGVIIRNLATSSATPPGLPPITPPPGETWNPTPGYTFMKTSDPVSGTTVLPGDTITYTLSGNNFGQTALDPVVITDDLAKVLPYATLDEASLAATIDGVAAPAPVVEGNSLTWSGRLEAGQVVTVTYAVTVKEGVEAVDSVITNTAGSSATPPGLPPITPPDVTTENPIPGFTLLKTADPVSGATVESGSIVTYTLTGANTGATVLDPVVITDDLSQVLSAASLEGAAVARINGTVTTAPVVSGSTLTWSGSLQPGETVTIEYSVKIDVVRQATTITNTASAEWTPPGLPPVEVPPTSTEHHIPPSPAGDLPRTGGTLSQGWIWFGLGAIVIGAALVVGRRRAAGKNNS